MFPWRFSFKLDFLHSIYQIHAFPSHSCGWQFCQAFLELEIVQMFQLGYAPCELHLLGQLELAFIHWREPISVLITWVQKVINRPVWDPCWPEMQFTFIHWNETNSRRCIDSLKKVLFSKCYQKQFCLHYGSCWIYSWLSTMKQGQSHQGLNIFVIDL